MSYKGNEYSFQIGAEINADVKALEKELNGLIGKMNANAEGTFTLNISEAKQSLDTLLETVSKIKSNFDNGVKVNIDTQSAEEDIKQLYAKLEDVAKNKSGDDGYIIKDAVKLQSILERVSSSLEKMKKTKLGEIFQTKDLATGELKTVLDENGKAMTLYDKIVSNADSNLAKVEQAVKDLSQALLDGQMPIEEYRKAMDDLNKLGLALAEGMYFGKPAVTFTIPGSGVNYVNLDGVTGIECPNCDSKAYAEAIKKLCNDDVLRQQYGEAARKRVLDNFTVEKFEENIRNFLEEL